MTEPTADADPDQPTALYQSAAGPSVPTAIGRYRVVRELGRGGYGVVYLAHDDRLDRAVAVKVPHPHLVSTPADADAYLAEARTVAGLEHPHIVPVFDTDGTPEHPCFVVSRFIDGSDLAFRMKTAPLTLGEAVDLVATVAAALHFAHTRGVVHRDVKPANLLLDRTGVPFVGDFGVALREQDVGRGPRYAGTPSYMSPEQARGEGHRVDGRSDVFALGVVLYELLTGRRPFRAATREELLAVIADSEPRPPRQVRDSIPRELERICLRALAKRVGERYTTAADLAADLKQVQADVRTITPALAPLPLPPPPGPTPHSSPVAPPPSETRPPAVMPKGLRAFDAADADFFLSLLPGPRDRDGLPDGLRFWKRWAEAADPDGGGGVGLMYGPSGCGKSSLVKAGLLPRLAAAVAAVYVEASADDTEARLLAALRKQVPGLPAVGLVDTLTAIRQGRFLPPGRSVLVVLDQFEQWLHAHPDGPLPELARGLRQCDGDRLRCVLLVRDDFWLAVSRFMRALEVRIEEDRNARLVDLFDRPHARKVLTAFGRAYGCLPDGVGELSDPNKAFLDRAVDGLAEADKVVSVRLALFAQMVKGKEWTPATLDAVGGAHGVGVTFLEEAFAGASAPIASRVHARAAQAILAALLPDGATGIKGAMRSEKELLAASGYADRPADFADALKLLDADLRLITPTDTATAGERHYQLTHDFLVPSLRDWLTRKQRETRRGRAELLLAERAGEWAARPDARWLPTLGEWLAVRLRTDRRTWTDPQRRMMRSAAAHHGRRVGLWAVGVLLACGLLFAGGAELLAHTNAANARDSLRSASVPEVGEVLDKLDRHRPRLEPGLRAEYDTAVGEQKLKLALALARWDASYTPFLGERLLDATPAEAKVLCDELARHPADELVTYLWRQAIDPSAGPARQFRAACGLATFDPDNPRWKGLAKPTVDRLVVQNPAEVTAWADLLVDVKGQLLPPLGDVICDSQSNPTVAQTATAIFRRYARPENYAPLERVAMTDTVALAVVAGGGSCGDTPLGHLRRRANAAAALVACGHGERVWHLLVHTPDPTLRSLLIERLAATRTDPDLLMARLKADPDVSARRALLLALGSYPADYPIPDEDHLLTLFEFDPDAGIHGASEWAARNRRRVNELAAITAKFAGRDRDNRGWVVNKSGMTFSVIEPKPPLSLPDGRALRVPYRYAVSTKEVTRKQWVAAGMTLPKGQDPSDQPVSGVSWYEMAEFCNRLNAAEHVPLAQWCYSPNPTDEYAHGMRTFDHRQQTGYRLTHSEEWECAGRAGATTASHCGNADDSLLVEYARYYHNSTRGKESPTSVGLLKPNDRGLFDIHGNVSERDHPFNVHVWGAGFGGLVVGPSWQPVMDRSTRLVASGGNVNSHISEVGTQFGGVGGSPLGTDPAMGFRVAITLPGQK